MSRRLGPADLEEISLQSLPGRGSPDYSSEIFGTDFSAGIFLQFFLGKYFLFRDSLEETVLQSLFGREYYSPEIFGTNFSAEIFW